MAKASKIGSQVYKALPEYWRQFWMYRSFTGEALTLLRKGKKEQEIVRLLFEVYVQEVASKQPTAIPVSTTPKRVYRKLNTPYWKEKTIKSKRFYARKQLTLHYASMLGQASKIASKLYRELPFSKRRRRHYWQFVGLAMQLLKEDWQEKEILEVFSGPLPSLSAPKESPHLKKPLGKLSYLEGGFILLLLYTNLPEFPLLIPRNVQSNRYRLHLLVEVELVSCFGKTLQMIIGHPG